MLEAILIPFEVHFFTLSAFKSGPFNLGWAYGPQEFSFGIEESSYFLSYP